MTVETQEEARALQYLVTGMLMGAMSNITPLFVDVEAVVNDEGDYEPWFFAQGENSGIRLKISVDVVE